MTLSADDLQTLAKARNLLVNRPLAVRVCETVGKPFEAALGALPSSVRQGLDSAVLTCLEKAARAAVKTLGDSGGKPHRPALYRGFAALGGFAAGLAGLPGLAVEAPITTVAMTRAVAHIGLETGFPRGPELCAECLQVLALDGGKPGETAATYFAVRAALSRNLSEVASLLTGKILFEDMGLILTRLLGAAAQRFSAALAEKLAVQSIPLLGAAGGAAVNYVFMSRYQDLAKAHFSIRELERLRGKEAVREAYERLDNA